MKYNSIKIDLGRSQVRTFELFAMDADALTDKVKQQTNSYCTQFSKERDAFLWNQIDTISKEEVVYFRWMEAETADLVASRRYSVNLDIRAYTRLMKTVLKRDIINYFRQKGMPVCRDKIGAIEVWEKLPSSTSLYDEYQRYRISPQVSKEEGWRLDVMQGSRSRVSTCSTEYFEELPAKGYDVLAGTMVLRPDEVPSAFFHEEGMKLYPIYSRTIESQLNFSGYQARDTDKMRNKLTAIRNFVDHYIVNLAFTEQLRVLFPNGSRLIDVSSQDIYRVDDAAHTIEYGAIYGSRMTGKKPSYEFRKYGPYEAPKTPYEYFFLTKSDEQSLRKGRRLMNLFRLGRNCEISWKSLSDEQRNQYPVVCNPINGLIGRQLTFNKKLCMVYESEQTAIDQLRTHLENNTTSSDGHYFAFIVSDISRDDPDPVRHKFYYLLKMELLKHHIQSQVIYRENIGIESFKYFVPNIAAAMVDKMGGLAWSVKSLSTKRDMVVGIGASYRGDRTDPYLGNAVSFDRHGKFIDFDICHTHDVRALSMKLKEDILRFRKIFGSPERLIIHYYKKLNRTESREIEKVLLNCGIDCEVYVVNIVEASNDDVIAFDVAQQDYMPLSGTYIHLRGNSYLLYNNERYDNNERVRNVVFPIKLTIVKTGRADLNDGSTQKVSKDDARDIITQVYQFCRLYHRSVSMQAYPITVAYPERVALFASYLDDDVLPDLAHNSLWML